MKRFSILVTVLVLSFNLLADEITKITGFAPTYVGKQIEIFQIVDYLSMKQERIASTTVQEDSTFSCSFFLKETQKLVLTSNNNSGFLYANPGATYDIFMPDRNPHDPYRPLGNKIELKFYGLDSTDINYKILEFNRWLDLMLGMYYTKNNAETGHFAKRVETFKSDVTTYYKKDSNDRFFMEYVRYSLGRVDNMRFVGSRNQYEKYDFYLRSSPVYYQSDTYMEYFNVYYDEMLRHIDKDINNRFYLALLKSSPTLIMNSLASEYTTKGNIRLRELVMIKVLADAYHQPDYPQTNITTVLDSLSKFALFEEHRVIAQNIMSRLQELVPGAKAPDFTVSAATGVYDLKRYSGRHLYLFFVSPESKESQKQIELLAPIYQRYIKEVQFLMVIRKDPQSDEKTIAKMQQSVPWESVIVENNHAILKTFQVINTPYYVLIDPIGYVVAAPALGPTPNGQYETIDKTFYYIKKAIDEGTGDGR